MNPNYILYTPMVKFLDQVQWAFSGTLGKSEAIITGVSHDIFSWATFLPQVLHTRKYRNRLAMNMIRGKLHLHWPTCSLLWKSLQKLVYTIATFALVGMSCFFGNE